MNRLPRWLVYTGTLLLFLVTLIALFYALEDWRGHQAWESARISLEKKQEPLTFAELRTRKKEQGAIDVPPALADWFNSADAADWVARLDGLPEKPVTQEREAWVKYLVEVQRRLGIAEPLVASNAAPIWVPIDPLNPHETLMPHLMPISQIAKLSRAEAEAGIALERPELALRGIERLERLHGWVASPPFLTAALVGLSIEAMIYQLIEEGLERDLWSDSERAQLRAWVEQSRPTNLISEGLRGERIFFLTITKNLTPARVSELIGMMERGSEMALDEYAIGLLPRGWVQQDSARFALAFQQSIEALAQGQAPESKFESSRWKHPLTRMAVVAIDGVIERAMEVETLRQQVVEAFNKENDKRLHRSALSAQGRRCYKWGIMSEANRRM